MTPEPRQNDDGRSTRSRSSPGDEPGSGEDENEEMPAWLRWVLIGSFLLSAVLLLTAFLYPRFRSGPRASVDRLPEWKQRANEMIDLALEKGYAGVPELLEGLGSNHPKIRQNAEWGLYYVTDLPWAEKPDRCRTWWEKFGARVRDGEEPPVDPPRASRFSEHYALRKANLDVFFNLISSGRVELDRQGVLANYEVGIVNKNEETPIRIYPPETLPYRAYRYRPDLPESMAKKFNVPDTLGRVPVHLQYGPSVALVLIKWFDPANSLASPVRSEFLEYTVLGRGEETLAPGQIKGKRSRFPVRWNQDLLKTSGPHAVARLVLDGRQLLIGYGEENETNVRVSYDDVTHVLKVFRKQPDSVPGYPEKRLSALRSAAARHGYEFTRAERITVGGGSGNRDSGEPTSSRIHPPRKGAGSSPTDPIPYGAHAGDLPRPTLIFDPARGWGRLEKPCTPCRDAYQQKHLLSRIEVRPENEPEKGDSRTAPPSTARRWILVFEKKEK